MKNLKTILLYGDTYLIELEDALISFFWGLWLLNPYSDSFLNTKAFDDMSKIADENVWGVAMLAISILMIYGLIRNDKNVRRWCMFFLMTFWFFITIMVFHSNPGSTGAVVYLVQTLMSCWVYIRLKQ